LDEGYSSFSDIAALRDGTILTLYESVTPEKTQFNTCIILASYTADWIKQNAYRANA
jgi:hypothetical protein